MKITAVETRLARIPFDMGAKPVSFGGMGRQHLLGYLGALSADEEPGVFT